MEAELERLRDEVIFKLGQITHKIGLNKSMGRLYAALYFSQRPLAFDELVKICAVSKGNVSINIRRLEKWGAVKKIWVKDSRKDHYEAEKDIIGFALSHSKDIFTEILDNGGKAFEDVKVKIESLNNGKLNAEQKAIVSTYKTRIHEVDSLIRKLKKLSRNFKMIETIIRKI